MANLNTIKNWFKTGLKPTQQQFWDTWDSFWHKEDNIPVANIEGIDSLLNQKSNKSVVDNHLTDANAHANLFSGKEDKSKKGEAEGYSPLDSEKKIPAIHLKIVDDLTSGGRDSILSAEQGKELKELIGNKQNIKGTNYSYVTGAGTAIDNGIELQEAYNLAKQIVGLSATNRYKIIVGTGKYEIPGQFVINTQYIDIVSLTGDADVEFANGIDVTANNVYLKGLKTPLSFKLGDNLNLLVCENCEGGSQSFCGYISANPYGIASGTFINCYALDNSFGSYINGSAAGKFINCKAGVESFCNPSGILTNCEAKSSGFLGYASGTITSCVAGQYSYGNSYPGGLTGKLFYCRLTAGTFIAVSGGGRTYYCVDGNGNPNNQ